MYSGQTDFQEAYMAPLHYPRLIADIGGTHSRFALQHKTMLPLSQIKTFQNQDYTSFAAVIQAYLTEVNCHPREATLAIAANIQHEPIITANIGWPFSRAELIDIFQFDRLTVVNDFTALALALPLLEAHEYQKIGGGEPKAGRPLALIGPGTGLGVSGLVPTLDGQWVALQSEGGHITLAATDDKEAELIQLIRRAHPHVSAERLLSGAGLPNLYHAMALLHGKLSLNLNAREIIHSALHHTCAICSDTLDTFCAMLGTVAGNLAMTLGAQGGVYLGGGIIPLLGSYFIHSRFRPRFEDKGQLHKFVASIPTYMITIENPALRGAAVAPFLSPFLNG